MGILRRHPDTHGSARCASWPPPRSVPAPLERRRRPRPPPLRPPARAARPPPSVARWFPLPAPSCGRGGTGASLAPAGPDRRPHCPVRCTPRAPPRAASKPTWADSPLAAHPHASPDGTPTAGSTGAGHGGRVRTPGCPGGGEEEPGRCLSHSVTVFGADLCLLL